jgi:hypothetical protein
MKFWDFENILNKYFPMDEDFISLKSNILLTLKTIPSNGYSSWFVIFPSIFQFNWKWIFSIDPLQFSNILFFYFHLFLDNISEIWQIQIFSIFSFHSLKNKINLLKFLIYDRFWHCFKEYLIHLQILCEFSCWAS